MIKKIHIQNFRGIEDTTITDIKHINIIFGMNNCGKSTVLESLFLILGMSNPTLPISVNLSRDLSDISEETLHSLFYSGDSSRTIEFGIEAYVKRNLKISLFSEYNKEVNLNEKIDEMGSIPQKKYGLRLDFHDNGNPTYTSKFIINEENDKKQEIAQEYSEKVLCKYLPSRPSLNSSIKSLEAIIKRKGIDEVVSLLKVLEPRIKDLQLVGKQIMVDLGFQYLLPINVMGDGVRKLLSYLVSLMECQNGILLIDEFENGLHYSVMEDVCSTLVLAAKMYNVQLFVTTHSWEILDAFSSAMSKKPCSALLDKISYIKLMRDTDYNLHSFNYTNEGVVDHIHQNIEIR